MSEACGGGGGDAPPKKRCLKGAGGGWWCCQVMCMFFNGFQGWDIGVNVLKDDWIPSSGQQGFDVGFVCCL